MSKTKKNKKSTEVAKNEAMEVAAEFASMTSVVEEVDAAINSEVKVESPKLSERAIIIYEAAQKLENKDDFTARDILSNTEGLPSGILGYLAELMGEGKIECLGKNGTRAFHYKLVA